MGDRPTVGPGVLTSILLLSVGVWVIVSTRSIQEMTLKSLRERQSFRGFNAMLEQHMKGPQFIIVFRIMGFVMILGGLRLLWEVFRVAGRN